jgi:hypothetical protein
LLLGETAAQINERVWLVFPIAIVGAILFGEFSGCGGVEGSAGCGLELDDEDFENLEGRGDDGPLIWT